MRISIAIFAMLTIGITSFGIGAYSGWNSGIDDAKSLYQCVSPSNP